MHHKNSVLLVCALARDCATSVPANIRRLEKLSKYFKEIHYIIIENNSKDNTRKLLEAWQTKSSLPIYMPVTSLPTDIDFLPIVQNKFFSPEETQIMRRMKKMAYIRDIYLQETTSLKIKPDYIMMLDIDIHYFSIRGILKGLNLKINWDALTANGEIYQKTPLGKYESFYYDSYALELLGKTKRALDYDTRLQTNITKQLKKHKYIQVQSAFCALAIYKRNALFDENMIPHITYTQASQLDDFSFCEHISFHHKLAELGFRNIYIYSRLKVLYNSKRLEKKSLYKKDILQVMLHTGYTIYRKQPDFLKKIYRKLKTSFSS